jgi:O-antigen ligase
LKQLKKLQKEAYLIPIYLCLFLIPIFYFPIFRNSFTQGKEILLKLLIVITFTIAIVHVLRKKKISLKPIWKNKILILLGAAGLLILYTNTFSPTPIIALYGTYSRGFGMIIKMFLAAFILYGALNLNDKTITKALKVVFISGVLVGIYAILQKLGIDPLFTNYDTDLFVGRTFSSMGNPGYLGQFSMLIFIVGMYLTFNAKSKLDKIIYGVLTAIPLAALIFSQTRGAMLALGASFFLMILRYRKQIFQYIKKLRRSLKIGIIVVACLSVIAGILLVSNEKLALKETATRSLSSRFQIWKGAIHLIQQRPFTGFGEESFYVYAPEIITKEFLTLEENINLSIDRIHNEFLEVVFSHGIFVGLIYLILFGLLLKIFLTSKNKLEALLALLIVGNVIQNQFAFPDITMSLFISFCLGGIIAIQTAKKKSISWSGHFKFRYVLIGLVLLIGGFVFVKTVLYPFMSQISYANSHKNYSISYDIAINEHKEATRYTPYYSELWYELMFLDSSSMPRALHYLEQIEGESGNLLAWQGNYYSDSDPAKSSQYFLRALEKNPYQPSWIRAYADMLYKNGEYAGALYLYNQYLEAVPEFWKWSDGIEERSAADQKSYRIFFKNVPDFWVTVERVIELGEELGVE